MKIIAKNKESDFGSIDTSAVVKGDNVYDEYKVLVDENKKIEVSDSPLRNAPHTAKQIASENWPHKYSRETAAFPMPGSSENKFWPHVGRVDNVHGDKNLICSCNLMEEYMD